MNKGKKKVPQFAAAFRTVLPSPYTRTLYACATELIDECLIDLHELNEGTAWEHTVFGLLPPRYQPRYTHETARAFTLCVMTVVWKLGQPKSIPLACVGEELAAAAIIDVAKDRMREKGKDPYPYDALTDMWFEDTDYEYLYEGRADGIEDTAFGKEVMAIVNLKLEDWFKPFRPEDPTHPYLWE